MRAAPRVPWAAVFARAVVVEFSRRRRLPGLIAAGRAVVGEVASDKKRLPRCITLDPQCTGDCLHHEEDQLTEKRLGWATLAAAMVALPSVGCVDTRVFTATDGHKFGPGPMAPADSLRASGVRDLPCPADQITLEEVNGVHPSVTGCGWLVHYSLRYGPGGMDDNGYELTSRSPLAAPIPPR